MYLYLVSVKASGLLVWSGRIFTYVDWRLARALVHARAVGSLLKVCGQSLLQAASTANAERMMVPRLTARPSMFRTLSKSIQKQFGNVSTCQHP
jgi:hypothetical protein